MVNYQLQLIDQWTKANQMKLDHHKSSVIWFRVSNHQQIPNPPIVTMDDVL